MGRKGRRDFQVGRLDSISECGVLLQLYLLLRLLDLKILHGGICITHMCPTHRFVDHTSSAKISLTMQHTSSAKIYLTMHPSGIGTVKVQWKRTKGRMALRGSHFTQTTYQSTVPYRLCVSVFNIDMKVPHGCIHGLCWNMHSENDDYCSTSCLQFRTQQDCCPRQALISG